MGIFRVDTSRWPIVIHSVEGSPTEAELESYIREATAVLARGERHVTILDASRIGDVPAYVRTRSMDWQRQHRDLLREWCVGTAYVLGSPLLRFVAMTVLMMTELPTPYTVQGDLAAALSWAERRLLEAGVSPSGSRAR